MKRAKIQIISVPIIYGKQHDLDLYRKEFMILDICETILNSDTTKDVMEYVLHSKCSYGGYFVILVNDVLTVRDKKNIDEVILEIDISEMEA